MKKLSILSHSFLLLQFRLGKIVIWPVLLLLTMFSADAQQVPLYKNTSVNSSARADHLISQLTTDEKISLLLYNNQGVSRLGIPAYNWWNEALHGVARAGRATVFPQAIGLAATFNEPLVYNIASAIGDEARAKYNTAVKNNNRGQYFGLTFWSPNINIFRDPRWGRGHETYGEDPFLTAKTGAAFVRGLQGNDPRYYKAAACAKHFAVHSGPEPLRHEFNAIVSKNDLYNTYLPAFKTLVKDAKVAGLMCAYNRTDSLPCCGSEFLLQDILRKEWGFNGYVVTDCWALDDIFRYHKFVKTEEEAAALAVKSGVNVECGTAFKTLRAALDKKLVSEEEINSALKRNLETLFRLGFFDPPAANPYSRLGETVVNSPAHQKLARQAAAESVVLLSNKSKTLPLSPFIKNILVTGPNADESNVLLANYNGLSGNLVTILEGITGAVSSSTSIMHNKGCHLTDTSKQDIYWAINDADAVVAVLGLSPYLEGENGDAYLSEAGGDKKDISFPYAQLKYLRALREKTTKPIIAVITAGSAIELKEVEQLADAVMLVWYPGEQGGNAVADILFGKQNPSGRLPVTFYESNKDLPSFSDYSMQGRTYRYFNGNVTHPFGFGLSYTSFNYTNLAVSFSDNDYTIRFDIKNTGDVNGAEVPQLYIRHISGNKDEPLKQLKGFQKLMLKKGETKKAEFHLSRKELEYYDEKSGSWMVYPGDYELQAGSSSADIRLSYKFTIK